MLPVGSKAEAAVMTQLACGAITAVVSKAQDSSRPLIATNVLQKLVASGVTVDCMLPHAELSELVNWAAD
jgi:hypothetical protein